MAAHSFAHDLLLCDVSCALWDCPWPVSRDGTCGEAEDAFAEVCHASWRLVRHFDLHVEQGISLLLGSLPAVHEGEQRSRRLLDLLLIGPAAYGSRQGICRRMDHGRLFRVHPWRGKLHYDRLHNSGSLSVRRLQQECDGRLPDEQNRHEVGSNDLHHVDGPGLAPLPLHGSGLDMGFCCRGGSQGKLALSPAQRVLAYALNLLLATILKTCSAMGIILAGITKDIVIVVISSHIFGDYVATVQYVGFAMTLSGCACWSLIKLMPDGALASFLKTITLMPEKQSESLPLVAESSKA